MSTIPLAAVLLMAFALPPYSAAQGTCQAPEAKNFPANKFSHISHNCVKLTYPEYPPTTGAHFASDWAMPGTYKLIMSPGYWLHSVEHGAVVILVNCKLPGNCDGDFSRLQTIADAFPRDSSCTPKANHRIVITADTAISTRFALVAANWSLLSDCLDSAAFAGFMKDHYAKAPEDLCGGGTDFSGAGWCNAPLSLAPAQEWHGISELPLSRWPGLPVYVRPDGRELPASGPQ